MILSEDDMEKHVSYDEPDMNKRHHFISKMTDIAESVEELPIL